MCTADEEEHAPVRRGHGPSRDCARGPTPWSAPSDPGADQLDGGAPRASTPRGCAPGRAAGSWWVCCWKSPLVAALRGGVAGLDSAARTRSRVGVPGVGAGIRDARHGGEFLSGVSAWGSSCCMLHPCLIRGERGCSSMVELQLPKLTARVRFPSPAPARGPGPSRFGPSLLRGQARRLRRPRRGSLWSRGHSTPSGQGCTAGDISVRPGACPSEWGQSTPSATGILSPHAQLVPVGRKVSPAARNHPTGGHHPLTPSSPTELATP